MRPPGSLGTHLWEALTRATAPPIKQTIKPKTTARPFTYSGPHSARAAARVAPSPAAATQPAATRTTKFFSDSVSSFVNSIAGGTFRSIKRPGLGGRYIVPPQVASPRLHAKASPAPTFTRINARSPPRSGFASARPSFQHSFKAPQVGLQSARNFSSGQPVFSNIVNNAPLALRALYDTDRLDSRKWRRTVHGLRRKEKESFKGKAKMVERFRKELTVEQEFTKYFGGGAATVAVAAEKAEGKKEPIVLVIPLEPGIGHLLSHSTSTSSDANLNSYRLLTPAVLRALDSVTTAYTTQAHKIRALTNSLSRAGVDEDPNVRLEAYFGDGIGGEGVKEVHVVFGGRWTMQDVLQATGDWSGGRREGAAKDRWYTIIGPSFESRQDDDIADLFESEPALSFSQCDHHALSQVGLVDPTHEPYIDDEDHFCSNSPRDSLDSSEHSTYQHDLVASSFHFPSPLDFNATPYSSPAASLWGDEEQEDDAQSIASTSLSEEGDEFMEVEQVERQWDSVMTRSRVGSDDYLSGLQQHLSELEELERERPFSRL